MFPLAQSSQQQYDHLPTSETSSDVEYVQEKSLNHSRKSQWSKTTKIIALICAVLALILGLFALGYATHNSPSPQNTSSHDSKPASGNCTEPYYRKEWRSLSKDEKKEYLEAFQCFIDHPSKLGMNGSLYDDFSWVHNAIAHRTHTKAPFLTWHRRFLFVYERHLRQSCGYKGAVPFWDWSLDWEDPMNSTIFDSKLGFGGDGDPNAPLHHGAHCVTDSPFKNLTPKWYSEEYDPHCLSRVFNEDWYAHYLNPEAMEKTMSSKTYNEFFQALELEQHDIIPLGIRGDFTSFTAPNDPIFYLHHSQLDRVWWLWQQRDKKNRLHDYGGEGDGGIPVQLTDTLPLAGLDKDVTVADIMNTEAGEMCYRYMYA